MSPKPPELTTMPHLPSLNQNYVSGLGWLTENKIGMYRFLGPYTPDAIPIAVKKKMRRDSQLAFGLTAIKAPIIGDKYYIDCKSKIIKAETQSWFEQNRVDLLWKTLRAADFGFQAIGLGWENTRLDYSIDGKIHTNRNAYQITHFQDYDPSLVEILINKNTGKFEGISYKEKDWQEPVILTKEQVFVYTFLEEFGNMYGIALLEFGYNPWYWGNQTYLMANRYIENKGEPPIVGFAPTRTNIQLGTAAGSNLINAIHYMGQQLVALRGTGGGNVVLPSDHYMDETGKPVGRKFDVKLLEDNRRADLFIDMINQYETMKLRSLWIPPRHVDASDKTGSYGAAEQQTETAMTFLDFIADLVVQALNTYVIWQPAYYEHGPNAPRPYLRRVGISDRNSALFKDIIQNMLLIERSNDFQGQALHEMIDKTKLLERENVPVDWQAIQSARQTQEGNVNIDINPEENDDETKVGQNKERVASTA
jgi:hypothetical protein